MKREDLQKIEGLTKEQIDSIMNLHQTDVTGWNTKFENQKKDIQSNVSYGGTAYPSDKFAMFIYECGKLEKVGETFEEIEVETWNETETSGEFRAYQRKYEVQPSNPGSGEGGGKLTVEGTFAQKGKVTTGKFNISTKKFTAD